MKRRLKFNSKGFDNVFGHWDSKHEYSVFCKLNDKQKNGHITNLERQVPFELIPAQYHEYDEEVQLKTKTKIVHKRKLVEHGVKYVADFTFYENGKFCVVDAKSEITRKQPDYIIKRKLMLYIHNIKVIEL